MPPEIRASLLLWSTALVAIEAGAGLVASPPAARFAAMAAAAYLVIQMSRGRNWARVALTVLFAGVATPMVAAESLRWLAESSGFVPVLFAASVIAHVAAVVAALVYMYLPRANRYFRDARGAARADRGGAAPARRGEPVPEFR
jgi:hypothetical protein